MRDGDPLDWTLRAACLGMPAATFFTTAGVNGAAAKRVCDGCTVRAECLAYVMEKEGHIAYRHGIWGGLTPLERRALAKAGWVPGDPLPDVRFPKSQQVA